MVAMPPSVFVACDLCRALSMTEFYEHEAEPCIAIYGPDPESGRTYQFVSHPQWMLCAPCHELTIARADVKQLVLRMCIMQPGFDRTAIILAARTWYDVVHHDSWQLRDLREMNV